MMEYAINTCVAQKDMAGLIWLGSGATVLFLLFLAGTKMRMRLMADVSNRVLLNIREELYEHIQTLGFGFFDRPAYGKGACKDHRRCEFIKRRAVRQRDPVDTGLTYGHLCGGHYADKELSPGNGGIADPSHIGGGHCF